MNSPHSMIPKPDELDADFYRANVDAGTLCLQHCRDCSAWTHPPRYHCPACFSDRMGCDRAGACGVIYSETVSHYTVEASWKEHVPYTSIVVELDEGPRSVATARNMAAGDLAIGRRVKVVLEAKSPDFAIFWAEPDREPA